MKDETITQTEKGIIINGFPDKEHIGFNTFIVEVPQKEDAVDIAMFGKSILPIGQTIRMTGKEMAKFIPIERFSLKECIKEWFRCTFSKNVFYNQYYKDFVK